ncbi:MAG: chitobiase/beta-hexosaminidase C-terminal domain-containing protein [Christensenellaceae bacterium]|nr:chitobiase/beta-hexosaminidase C-terminal domain-containing protein [Christensenellaceae bacterium]
MLCPKCGSYATGEDILCPQCGALLTDNEEQESGVRSIRQGRSGSRSAPSTGKPQPQNRLGASRTYVDASARLGSTTNIPLWADPEIYDQNGERMSTGKVRPVHEMGASTVVGGRLPDGSRAGRRRHQVQQGGINWAHMAIVLTVLVIGAIVGVALYLTQTADGQVIMARLGREADAAALWQVGGERLDTGDLNGAIEYFLMAREKDGTENINVTGLLNLGSAYEANGQIDEAEELYTEIYTDIVPSAPEAYRNVVRIMLAQGRDAEAAELLKLAYQTTGQDSFRQQRVELLPSAPRVDVVAAYYNQKKTLTLTSEQGYDIYYTFDPEAVLPEEGKLYTAPIDLEEGEWPLRAVAVSETMVSDPLSATYQIYMPTPLQPNVHLAPGTYQKAQNVRLSPGSLTKEQLADNPGYASTLDDPVAQTITIYYTIDGSIPDQDSPIYDGTPVYIATRRATIRAVSVNGYNKASNTKEVGYVLKSCPWPKDPFRMADAIGGLTLNITTREEFFAKYGQSESVEDATLGNVTNECQRHIYPWGYATMMRLRSGGWVLGEVYFTTEDIAGPRGTGIGSTEADVVSKFQDMGQIVSPSGNRGLYEDQNSSDKGKIYVQEDGGKLIQYVTDTADGNLWYLNYWLDRAGLVTAIQWYYQP